MLNRLADLRCKEVINVADGCRLGFVCDVEIDIVTGRVAAIIVPGPCRILGLFGRDDDYIIPWECIRRIGEDMILIEVLGEHRRGRREKRAWL